MFIGVDYGNKVAVVAIGGNSLIKDKNKKSLPDQYFALYETCTYICQMIRMGWRVIITHGNGPQVGYILERSDRCLSFLHPVPLDYCNADTEGAIGYMIQQIMYNLSGGSIQVLTVPTQVVVDATDQEWQKPTKPVGSFYRKDEAERIAQQAGWMGIMEDPQGRGFRRVVPSPKPIEVIEINQIRKGIDAGFVVVAVGGGGIPVIRKNNILVGAEAVIDKDRASALLASLLSVDLLLISTEIPMAYVDFKKDSRRGIKTMSPETARMLFDKGEFPPGNMGPKVDSIINFVANGGKAGIITDPSNISLALEGKTGTLIAPGCEMTYW